MLLLYNKRLECRVSYSLPSASLHEKTLFIFYTIHFPSSVAFLTHPHRTADPQLHNLRLVVAAPVL